MSGRFHFDFPFFLVSCLTFYCYDYCDVIFFVHLQGQPGSHLFFKTRQRQRVRRETVQQVKSKSKSSQVKSENVVIKKCASDTATWPKYKKTTDDGFQPFLRPVPFRSVPSCLSPTDRPTDRPSIYLFHFVFCIFICLFVCLFL